MHRHRALAQLFLHLIGKIADFIPHRLGVAVCQLVLLLVVLVILEIALGDVDGGIGEFQQLHDFDAVTLLHPTLLHFELHL